MSFSSFAKKTNPIKHPVSSKFNSESIFGDKSLHIVHRERLPNTFVLRGLISSGELYYLKPFGTDQVYYCPVKHEFGDPSYFHWYSPVSSRLFEEAP